jgi:hypothetical protein
MAPLTRHKIGLTVLLVTIVVVVLSIYGWRLLQSTLQDMQCQDEIGNLGAYVLDWPSKVAQPPRVCPVTGAPYAVVADPGARHHHAQEASVTEPADLVVWETVPHADGTYRAWYANGRVVRAKKPLGPVRKPRLR